MIYLIPLISFLGLILGNIFYYVAKEEIWYSKFWYNLLMRILLLSIAGVLVYSLEFNWLLLVGFVLGLFLAGYISIWVYFGISLLVSYILGSNILFLISSLVFIYGLPYGTLMRRVNLLQFLYLFLLFVVPLLLYFSVTYIGHELFLGFAVAGLIRNILEGIKMFESHT